MVLDEADEAENGQVWIKAEDKKMTSDSWTDDHKAVGRDGKIKHFVSKFGIAKNFEFRFVSGFTGFLWAVDIVWEDPSNQIRFHLNV